MTTTKHPQNTTFVHDRRAQILPFHAHGIAVDIVADPYGQNGEQITVVRNIKDDPLAGMMARRRSIQPSSPPAAHGNVTGKIAKSGRFEPSIPQKNLCLVQGRRDRRSPTNKSAPSRNYNRLEEFLARKATPSCAKS